MKRRLLIAAGCLVGLFVLFLCLPVPRFEPCYSTAAYSSDGRLLAATIAADGQWRFPASNDYSAKYVRCLLEYEDRLFFVHSGINPVTMFRSAVDNKRAGKIVRGGSTISMQVVRMARGNRPRTYSEKMIEIILALRLELRYSKTSILNMYAANAPFGGNVVGIDAAAWRYFNTTPDRLTWAEAATLALLPNSPSMVNVERGRDRLKAKRDKLLLRVLDSKAYIPKGKRASLDSDDYELAIEENIPDRPFAMPTETYHYMCKLKKEHEGERVMTDIDFDLQYRICDIVRKHHDQNEANLFENYGVYVLDHVDNKIVAYVGNEMTARQAAMVDMVSAQHSTGSILKPFLYAASIDAGVLFPKMILPDVPVNIGGYTPRNFSGSFCGALPADEALARSLNAPFIHLLRKYGYQRFHHLLRELGIEGIRFSAEHYGLTIILGGAEASLFDVVNAYGKMVSCLDGKTEGLFSPEAVAYTLDAMTKVNRPGDESGLRKLAWKTGTSFGFRDAWSVGVTDRYVIGVWCGNANGEGRSNLIGVEVSAPVLFDVFYALSDTYSFKTPSEGNMVEVCAQSGFPVSECCTESKKIVMPDVEIMTGRCPYHKKVFLDPSRRFRLSPRCSNIDPDCFEYYFVLPPVMEWFYTKQSFFYKSLPPLSDCTYDDDEVMSFVYPETSVNIIIPKDMAGRKQSIVFKVAHRDKDATIFWNLNDDYLGKTVGVHDMPVSVSPGRYVMKCVDSHGRELVCNFVVEGR